MTVRDSAEAGDARPGAGPGTSEATTRARLHALPKTELHVHLDGSLRPVTMVELAAEYGTPLPSEDPEELGRLMLAEDTRNLEEYLGKFEITLSLLQRADALERVAYELAVDCAAENVRYLEVRYCPALNTREGLTPEEAVDAPLRGLRRAEEETGMRTAVIVSGLRHMDPRATLELADLAVAYREHVVVGFDLAGPERGHPATDHRDAFLRAADGGLAVTIHAGEAAGPDSIRQALDCGARRIGHGTRLFEDPELQRFVKERRVPLEVCLTSNVQTGAVRSLEAHPLRRYFDDDLVVTLNTDNRLVSGTTLTDEYLAAHRRLGFSWRELCEVALMGFESAFLHREEKRALIRDIRAEIETL